MHDYVPSWGLISDEIRDVLHGVVWPPVHGLFARLAAEGGFPALALWFAFWFSLTWKCLADDKDSSLQSGKVDWLRVALVISMRGVFDCGLNIDSFRFPGYWISMGVAWAYFANQTSDGAHPPGPKR